MNYLAPIFFTLLFSYNPQLRAQNLVGNGGDVIASEFNSIARTALYFLKTLALSPDDQKLVEAVEVKVDTVLLESVPNPLILNNREVDAVNIPTENKILISRSRWEQIRLRTPSERTQIVLHEFIWIANYDDGNYKISSRLTALINDDLQQNSISTEKYQVALAQFYSEMMLFRMDLMQMQTSQIADYPLYCMGAGALKAHSDRVIQLTTENIFWFSMDVRSAINTELDDLNEFSKQHIDICVNHKEINFSQQLNTIQKLATFIKNLMRMTQFAGS